MTFIPPLNSQGYVALPVTIDPNQMVQQALADIAAQLPGWTPREGHLEVAVIEEAAQMASVSGQVASQMAPIIFMYYGALVGITPITGVQATAAVTITAVDTAGYTIPAGTVIGYPTSGSSTILFTVQSAIIIAPGSSTGTGTIVCENVGTFANGLAAATCQMVTTNASVASVATTATSAGGIDAETQTAYLNRLTAELRLLAPRPILASDFAAMAPNVQGVYRAMAIDGLNPGRTVTDGVLNTTTTVTSATAAFTSTDVGRSVTGTGVPGSTTIASVTNSTTIVMSNAATATATGVHLAFGDLTGQERYVTVCGLDSTGAALSTGVNSSLQSYLNGKREVNFVVATIAPASTAIDVSVICDAVHGQSTSTVQAAITAALTAFLSPATWGGGSNTPPTWSSTAGTVRFLDVANVIRSVPGVLYIPWGFLTTCVHGGTPATADVVLPGDAPLPSVGSLTVTVYPT